MKKQNTFFFLLFQKTQKSNRLKLNTVNIIKGIEVDAKSEKTENNESRLNGFFCVESGNSPIYFESMRSLMKSNFRF